MYILLLLGSPAGYATLPQLGRTQIVAGSDWTDGQDAEGGWFSIKTSVADYSLTAFRGRIPAEQQSDAAKTLANFSDLGQQRDLSCFTASEILLLPGLEGQPETLGHALNHRCCEPFDWVVSLNANLRAAS
jgi:hypothetical protein